jgi:hypothetical protein
VITNQFLMQFCHGQIVSSSWVFLDPVFRSTAPQTPSCGHLSRRRHGVRGRRERAVVRPPRPLVLGRYRGAPDLALRARQRRHALLANDRNGQLHRSRRGGRPGGRHGERDQLRLADADATVDARKLAAPGENMAGMRFNDGRCDRQGRFWSGAMALDMTHAPAVGNLYRYSADQGISTPVVSNLVTQNGLAWWPDGRTMYLHAQLAGDVDQRGRPRR